MKTNKFWNVAREEDVATIELYGDVWSNRPPKWYEEEWGADYISPETFREDLEAVKDCDQVVVKLNSCGGDAYTGIAIHNELKQLKAKKTVVVEGVACSAASIIAMAGDEIQVYPGSMIMIHGCSAMLWDYYNVEDLQKVLRGMEACNNALTGIYHARTGIGDAEIREMLKDETWFTGEEAVEAGFATTLLEDEIKIAASADKKVLLAAGVRHDVSSFHLPERVPVDKRIHSTRKVDENKTTNSVEKQEVTMTLEELKEQSPELVAEIETNAVNSALEEAKKTLAEQVEAEVDDRVNKAVKAEQERMAHIDEIASTINDADLIREAKYGENPMTAEKLAFEALKKQQAQGTAFLADMKSDNADSNVNEVEAEPNKGEEAVPEFDAKAFAQSIVDVIKKEKGEIENG